MSTQHSFARHLFILITLTQAGCQVPLFKKDSLPEQTAGGVHAPPPFQQSELSPKQAAKACIVTAENLEAAGHRHEAIGLYEKARQQDPQAIDYARRLAVLYDQEGNVANALREYNQAIDADPKNADLLNDFGYFHFTQGDLASAETNYRAAIALDGNHQRAWTNLGIVLAHQARYQESVDAFARIVGPAAAHSNLGTVLAKQGHAQQARQAFQQALAMNPNLKQPQVFLDHYAKAATQSGTMTIPASFAVSN